MKNKEKKEKKAAFGRAATQFTPDNIPLRIAYQCYFFCVGLVLLILSIISFALFVDKLEDYKYILENWRQDVVVDIKTTSSYQQTCSDLGPEYQLISNFTWSGTREGCDCRFQYRIQNKRILSDQFVPQDKVYEYDVCNSTQKDYGCVDVQEHDPKDFIWWSDTSGSQSRSIQFKQNELIIQGFQICAKRLKNVNFYSKAPSNEECNLGEKSCGSTDKDYFFCVQEDQQCPIVKMSYLNNQFPFMNQFTKASPIVEFRVSEYQVCLKNNLTAITHGREDYPLMKIPRKECASDSRFEVLNEIPETIFYEVNEMTYLEKSLSGYKIDAQYKWGFYNRGYILWKFECRGSILKDFLDQEILLDSIAKAQLGLMIISILFFVIISIILTAVSFMNILGFDWPCFKGSGTEESNMIFKIEAGLKIVLQLSHAIIIIIAFTKVQNEINYFGKIYDQKCSDDLTQETMLELKNVIQNQVYKYNLAQLILFIISAILDFIVIAKLALNARAGTAPVIDMKDANSPDPEENSREEQMKINQTPVPYVNPVQPVQQKPLVVKTVQGGVQVNGPVYNPVVGGYQQANIPPNYPQPQGYQNPPEYQYPPQGYQNPLPGYQQPLPGYQQPPLQYGEQPQYNQPTGYQQPGYQQPVQGGYYP